MAHPLRQPSQGLWRKCRLLPPRAGIRRAVRSTSRNPRRRGSSNSGACVPALQTGQTGWTSTRPQRTCARPIIRSGDFASRIAAGGRRCLTSAWARLIASAGATSTLWGPLPDALGATEASGVATWKRAVAALAPLLSRGLAPATLAYPDKRQGQRTWWQLVSSRPGGPVTSGQGAC